MNAPNHALQRTPGFGVRLPGAALIRPAQSRAVLPAMKPGTARAFASRRCALMRAPGPESLSLGSLGVATRIVFNAAFSHVFFKLHVGLHLSRRCSTQQDAIPGTSSPFAARSPFVSRFITDRRFPVVARRSCAQATATCGSLPVPSQRFWPPVYHAFNPSRTPNHALQRTPGFGVQLPGAAVVRPAQSRAVLPAMKPGTARAFALRRRAHSRAPGPESLSLGSLGVTRHA